MGTNRYVCIHGHWYQPPRVNPFTGVVEDQPSAAPFANWNERITAECYLPNSEARVLSEDGGVERRINNYAHISSDWGPTLLTWLEMNAPGTYESILVADRESSIRFGGHGSALAHAYNHTILPLSNSRDKKTQIRWGISDFRHRFGREPEGMWLPETAVDLESLDLMAAEGIGFTILAPHQAGGIVDGASQENVDTTVPHRVELPSGRSISVFFYNGALSQEIAFNGLLEDGVRLADRLTEAVPDGDAPVLSHVATDGETYGHHHKFGEMALARAVLTIESRNDATLTNYGQFLELRPSREEVPIREGTSWSCAHGVERWRSNCGCTTGAPGTHQRWRQPLRKALDTLRDHMIDDYEKVGGDLLADPWLARDEYIEVILGADRDQFLARHQTRPLRPIETDMALDLLEAQQRAMLMYTSCGWFFDDITRLEVVFVLRQAGRAIELTRRISGQDLEPAFLEILATAVSNQRGVTGRDVYEEFVTPYMGAWPEPTSATQPSTS